MRLLVTFVGGLGHLAPLLPVARAAREAGHEVAVAGSGGLVPLIEEAGCTAFATSPRPHHDQSAVAPGCGPLEVMAARAAELELADDVAERGARRTALAVPDVIGAVRPDLVLRDETDLGTTIAAELVGVPVASHLVLASGLLVRPELVAPRLDAVRSEHGLPPDPTLTRLTSGLVLSDAPPTLRSPDSPMPVTPTHDRAHRGPPAATSYVGRPSVYVTLGTIVARASGDLFERLLLVPLGADQPHHAVRAAELGVATCSTPRPSDRRTWPRRLMRSWPTRGCEPAVPRSPTRWPPCPVHERRSPPWSRPPAGRDGCRTAEHALPSGPASYRTVAPVGARR